jgi:hypothetical protein
MSHGLDKGQYEGQDQPLPLPGPVLFCQRNRRGPPPPPRHIPGAGSLAPIAWATRIRGSLSVHFGTSIHPLGASPGEPIRRPNGGGIGRGGASTSPLAGRPVGPGLGGHLAGIGRALRRRRFCIGEMINCRGPKYASTLSEKGPTRSTSLSCEASCIDDISCIGQSAPLSSCTCGFADGIRLSRLAFWHRRSHGHVS